MYRVYFSPEAKSHFNEWKNTNPKIAQKIAALVNSIETSPFSGIGKPEPLRHQYAGCWSRRIDPKNRLIYQIEKDQSITVLTCRGHYGDK